MSDIIEVPQSPSTVTNDKSKDDHIVDENYPEEQYDTEEKMKTTSTRDKYNKILPVMLNIATIATSHSTSQFTHWFEAMRQAKKFMRDGSDLNIIAPKKRAYRKEEEISVGNEEPPEQSHAPFHLKTLANFKTSIDQKWRLEGA